MRELKLILCDAAYPGSVALEGQSGDFTEISVGTHFLQNRAYQTELVAFHGIPHQADYRRMVKLSE
jgi:hypothetical protein